jgi:hypothetical protein
MLAVAEARGYSNLPVVQLHIIDRGVEFYAAGRVSYQNDGEPEKFEGAQQVADAARRNGGAVLALVPIELDSQLITLSGVNSEVVADNGSVALLVVRVR